MLNWPRLKNVASVWWCKGIGVVASIVARKLPKASVVRKSLVARVRKKVLLVRKPRKAWVVPRTKFGRIWLKLGISAR